jgi:hypothetical protein
MTWAWAQSDRKTGRAFISEAPPENHLPDAIKAMKNFHGNFLNAGACISSSFILVFSNRIRRVGP